MVPFGCETMKTYDEQQGLQLLTYIFASANSLAKHAAEELAQLINKRTEAGQWTNLGLATGSSPVLLYRELIAMHKAGKVSFSKVRIFMLDEYYGIEAKNKLSFRYFIETMLINHLQDFDRENFHIPNGTIADAELQTHCSEYEQMIREAGGIHYQLLGVGRNGHIGFNEPETAVDSRTGVRPLHHVTRLDAASDFFGVDNVPTHGISMGIGTILDAQIIRLVATNEGKALTIKALLENAADIIMPASALHSHGDTVVYIDEAAASELEVEKHPWTRNVEVSWDPRMLERFLMSESRRQNAPLDCLTVDLLDPKIDEAIKAGVVDSRAQALALVKERIAGRVTQEPGPQPGETVIVFSPHPDDAEIQCGGTIQRLLARDVRVVVVIMTSGRIAVWDHCARKIIDHVDTLAEWLGVSVEQARSKRNALLNETNRQFRSPGVNDSPELQKLKGMIRRNEATRGLKHLGVKHEDVLFLDLPFYETDAIEKAPPTQTDYDRVISVLKKYNPVQIYAAGDLSDPHGTHRTCLNIINQAVWELDDDDEFSRPSCLLYRGAWAEWPPYQMDIIVPISDSELSRAIVAMRKHESQIPNAMFPGNDKRPFDQRAEERKRAAGTTFTELGIGQIPAAEGFVYHEV